MLIIVGVLAFVMPAMLTTSRSSKLHVTSLSLGIEVIGREFSIIIPKNTPIPAKRSDVYITTKDYQTGLLISIYEGEDILVKNNNFLGEFDLVGIPSRKIGEEEVDVTLELDEGVLHVTAKVRSTGSSESVTIKRMVN